MKPTDKAILGMVSESPGRNESEPTGGLDKNGSDPLSAGTMDAATHAARQEADGIAAQAQGDLPRFSIPAGRRADRKDQSDSARLGDILCRRPLENGGTIENAQAIAAHESPRTTKLYDRTSDEITLDEVERIAI